MKNVNMVGHSQTQTSAWPFSEQARRTGPPPISWLMRDALEVPGMISLAAGFVDQASLPAKETAAICRSLFEKPETAQSALQYGSTFGDPGLRRTILNRLHQQNVLSPDASVSCDDIMIGNGSQQLLYLLSEALLDPGDIVLVEAPTYFVFLGILESLGARTIGLETDPEGVIPESLDETLYRLESEGEFGRVKYMYVMTYFANPTGRSWSVSRKNQIMEILRSHRRGDLPLLLVEDGAYRALSDSGSVSPPLKALDENNDEVMYLESFSKCLAPGLKVGCAVGPGELIAKMVDIKGNHDFGTANLAQQILLRSIESDWYDSHIADVRKAYKEKRERLVELLAEQAGREISFEVPEGGFYLWVQLRGEKGTGPESALFRRALEEKILYVPGAYCYSADRPESRFCSSLRLSYGMISIEQLVEGVRRLGRAIQSIGPA